MSGFTFAYRSGCEIGSRFGVNPHLGAGIIGLSVQTDGAGISACMRHVGVVDGGILLV